MSGPTDVALETAEIIAVGSELLTPFKTDTNSLFLTAGLNELGIAVRRKSIVGDEAGDLRDAVEGALGRVDLVVLSGGLGPTDDDLTRETVAALLGRPLVEQPELIRALEERFAARGWRMPENNRRQARVPDGAEVLPNPRGTAPGLWLEHDHRVVLLLPGPPRELEPMFTETVRERLAARVGRGRLFGRVLKIVGRGESHVAEATEPIYDRWRRADPPVDTTVLASPGLVELHLSTWAEDAPAAGAVLDGATSELARALGDDLLSTDGRSLPEVVGQLLQDAGLRVAVAESCTGGLTTARLVDVAGCSRYLDGAVVAYSNRVKQQLLGVPGALLEEHGAVSEPVAGAMAEGVRRVIAADIGVGITGVAGPDGGTAEKPVGTVCLAVAGPGADMMMRTYRLPGDRAMVRRMATRAALGLVRRTLLAASA